MWVVVEDGIVFVVVVIYVCDMLWLFLDVVLLNIYSCRV